MMASWKGYFFSVTLLSLFFTNEAKSCDCAMNPPFEQASKGATMVIKGRVKSYFGQGKKYPLGMNIEVISIYKGSKTTDVLKVWGDSGYQCRPYVTRFPVGSEWVFALKSNEASEPPSMGLEREIGLNDYHIFGCGEYWVKPSDRRVRNRRPLHQ